MPYFETHYMANASDYNMDMNMENVMVNTLYCMGSFVLRNKEIDYMQVDYIHNQVDYIHNQEQNNLYIVHWVLM